jgi:hypothetical protein
VNNGVYAKARVDARTIIAKLSPAYRIVWSKHAASPLAVRPVLSRFCDGRGYAVLYAAASLETAFIEVVVRDRFVRKAERIIPFAELALRSLVSLSTRPALPLSLLDLRETGCVDIGAPTDAIRARNQTAGRTLASALYQQHPNIDGLVYPSRLTGGDCFVVFDRALAKLISNDVAPLARQSALAAILERHDIKLLAD